MITTFTVRFATPFTLTLIGVTPLVLIAVGSIAHLPVAHE